MTVKAAWLQKLVATTAIVIAGLSAAQWANAASIAITEWMYSPVGGPGEYFEITNVSGAPINMSGWSEDDSTHVPGTHPLSGFGTLQPGESAVGTEGTDVAGFKSYWNLPASVKVIAYGSSDNLGRADEINIYNSSNVIVDTLKYDDQTLGGPRTQGTSANIAFANLGANHPNLAVASVVGDIYNSYRGGGGSGDLGNPGFYPLPVPEPASIALASIGTIATLGLVALGRRS